jgi:Ras family protein
MCGIIREKILDYTGRESVPMVLVGNKSDLAVQRYVPAANSLIPPSHC